MTHTHSSAARVLITIVVALVVLGVAVPPTVAGQRYPVMGCAARDPRATHDQAVYAPTTCSLSLVGPGSPQFEAQSAFQTLAHARWTDWGGKTATGHGGLVFCGTGGCITENSTFTITGLARRPDGPGTAYSRLVVTYRAAGTGQTTHETYDVWPATWPRPANGHDSSASLWAALGGKVICGLGIHARGQPSELLCSDRAIPPPANTTDDEGDPGFVYLGATGLPSPTRLSQYSWQSPNGWEASGRATLEGGRTWHRPGLAVTCTASATAVRCTNGSRHGFRLTVSSYTPF
jgi:hypothetical protein